MKRPHPPSLATAIVIDAVLVLATALIALAFAPGPSQESGVPARRMAVAAGPAAPRSPLERSHGYYPPADPESLSVIAGRRNAPRVALELTGGASSMRDLARLLLAGLQAKDERALHALRLTRREFEVICWPEFPESRPITRITADDAWELALPTSLAGAGRTIGLYGGQQLSLVDVKVGRRESYRNFTLHRDVVIRVQDEHGAVTGLRFVPSILERHGRFKALLFKD